ncbi:VOC family protein [soil metagenome]
MSGAATLGYAVFGVSNIDSWSKFAVDFLGLEISFQSENRLVLRMDDHFQRFVFERDTVDDLTAAGWEFRNEAELNSHVEKLQKAHVPVSVGSAALARDRGVEKIFICEDPNGIHHELYYGPRMALEGDKFHSRHMRGGFATDGLGFGHILCVSPDYDHSVAFYQDVIGLKISGYTRQEIHPGITLDAAFFHTLNGRYHSLATAQVSSKKRMLHFALAVCDIKDIGRAYDRALALGYPITKTLGHHPNAESISFYVKTPSGFDVELSWGEAICDDADWHVASFAQFSDWGHHNPAKLAQVQSDYGERSATGRPTIAA